MLEKTNHIIQWLTLNVLRLLRLQMLLGILSIICHCLLYIFSNQLHSLSSKIFMESVAQTLARNLNISGKKNPLH